MRSTRQLVVGVALVIAGGCAPAAAPGAPGPGDPCGPLAPCGDTVALVCLDGACVARPWLAPASSEPDAITPIVIDVVSPPETDVDAEVDTDADGAASDGDAGDVAPPDVAWVWIGAHTGADAPSGDLLTFFTGQGAVVDLAAPARGRLVALEVIAREPPGGGACAIYRPAAWEAEGGVFAPAPLWEGAPVVIFGADDPQVIAIVDGPEVGPGAMRAGLVFEQGCPDTPRQPILVVDDSGDVSGTWLWIRSTPGIWVPGSTLQLSGRWALRVALEVAVE